MDISTAIMERISRRTYLNTAISSEDRATLQQAMAAANEESGLHITWVENGAAAFAGGKSYGMFKGVRSLMVLKGSVDLPHLREKIGYYGERLILAATMLGLGTCWVGGTFDKNALETPPEEEIICVIPVGEVQEKSSLKERFLRGMIHRKTKTVEELLQSDAPAGAQLQQAMDLVQRAPSTRNTQKVRFVVQQGRITAQVPDDAPFDLVDLGIAKLHFECGMGGRFALGNGAQWQQAEAN